VITGEEKAVPVRRSTAPNRAVLKISDLAPEFRAGK
jgi:hypothetical protein